jgi:hypothetical protein
MKDFLKRAVCMAGLGIFAILTSPIMLAVAFLGEPESKEKAREMLPWTIPITIALTTLLIYINVK